MVSAVVTHILKHHIQLCDLAKALKNDANNKTHSWYHLVEKKKEIDNLNLKAIIEIIKKLEKVVGI